MKKPALLIFIFFLFIVPSTFALSVSFNSITYPPSVVSGQPIQYFDTMTLVNSINSGDCLSSGCLIELDPFMYNGQYINYISADGQIHYPIESTFQIGPVGSSACDSNPYHAGKIVSFVSGNYYQVLFNPKSPLQTGTWKYALRIYSGCGGSLLSESYSLPIQVVAAATCGNGVIESGEQCDGNNFGVKTCSNYGFSSGSLTCNSCIISTNSCSSVGCNPSCSSGYTCQSGTCVPITTCTSNWQPTAWTTCANGQQTRTIVDLNGCPGQTYTGGLTTSQSCSTGETNTSTSTSADFEIVDIRRISGWAENYINAGLLLGESKDNEIMKVTIKNTGTITSGTQLEAYFVSVTNPFYNIIKSSPRNCNILQSFYFQGILTESPSCKGDSAVRSYSIGKISPGTQIDVFIAVPENELDPPTSLAGYSNHNPDGKYLLVATAYNGCNGGSTIYYDQVARSVGEFNSPCGDLLTSTLIPGTNTTTTFDSPEAKTTLTAEQLKTATDVQLIASQCSLNSECESENCESLKSLIDSGQISEAKADEFMTRTNAVITGSTIGGVTAGVGCTAAVVLSSVVFTPVVGGVTALVCTAGGAALGGLIGYWTDKTVDALAERDTATFGYCMEDDASSFGSFISSIGHSINNQFGGPTKTKLDDATLGYTFFGLILIIIMFLVFKK